MMTHFKAHQGIHRVNTKTYSCPICKITFPRQVTLNEHLAAQHNTWTFSNQPTSSNLKTEKMSVVIHPTDQVPHELLAPTAEEERLANNLLLEDQSDSDLTGDLPLSHLMLPLNTR